MEIIGYRSVHPKGRCSHIHATERAAHLCGGWADAVTLPDALSEDRVPWTLIVSAGYDLTRIADDALARGDKVLHQRAMAAIQRHL